METLKQELEQKEEEYWDAHDAFCIARDALANIRNLIKGYRHEG